MKKIVSLVLCLALVLALGTVAFATSGDAYLANAWVKATTKNAEATQTDVTLTPAHETKDDKGNVTAGNILYYTVNGKNYVNGGSLAKADLIVSTDKDGKNVALYLTEVSAVNYVAATAVTNLGDKCGQYDKTDFDAKKTYYVDADEVVYVAAENGDSYLKVGDKFVSANETALKLVKVPHAAIPVVDPVKGIVGYKCSKCGLAAVLAPNYASIEAAKGTALGIDNWYWPAAAAATTAGVTSAKTFDAGVAMYAGLALMSVAGSAVVIGKKKEF